MAHSVYCRLLSEVPLQLFVAYCCLERLVSEMTRYV